MKVYALPKELPAPVTDYGNYDREKEDAAEKAHMAALKQWLVKAGFTGKLTGEVYQQQVADGYARYMVADGPKKFALVHLPYGDGYSVLNIQYLPKKAIVEGLNYQKRLNELFAKKKETK